MRVCGCFCGCLFQVALLFSLWTETVRPYLEIVDEWIVHGHLFDPAKEFIIQRYVTTFFFINKPKRWSEPRSKELTESHVQEQGRPGEPPRLLVRYLHAVQRL